MPYHTPAHEVGGKELADVVHQCYGDRIQQASRASIRKSTRSTYGSGCNAFDRWCRIRNLDGYAVTVNPDKVIAAFAVHLVQEMKVSPDTANQYVSHVLHRWEECDSTARDAVRTPALKRVITGLKNVYIIDKPKVDTERVPLHTVTCIKAITIADNDVAFSMHTRYARAACLALAYAASLRCSEVCHTSSNDPKFPFSRHARLFFGDTPYETSNPAGFPPHEAADMITFRIAYGHEGCPPGKADKEGARPHRCVARNPDKRQSEFCFLRVIERYIRQFPPAADGPIFMTEHGPLYAGSLTSTMRAAATSLGIDATRITPYSWRYGVLQNMAASSIGDIPQLRQGDWQSRRGRDSYLRATIAHATENAALIHDATIVPATHAATLFASL